MFPQSIAVPFRVAPASRARRGSDSTRVLNLLMLTTTAVGPTMLLVGLNHLQFEKSLIRNIPPTSEFYVTKPNMLI